MVAMVLHMATDWSVVFASIEDINMLAMESSLVQIVDRMARRQDFMTYNALKAVAHVTL